MFWNCDYEGLDWMTQKFANDIAARCCLEGGEISPTVALVAYVEQLCREYYDPENRAAVQAIMLAPR